MKRFATCLCLLSAALLSGCAGYKLGAVHQNDCRSVAVPMFRNRTIKPQLEAQVTNAIIKRLQTDGSLAVKSVDDADVIVRGEIIAYDRATLRGQRLDTTVPSELRLSIQARIEAYDRVTGAIVLPATVLTGSAETFMGADQQTAEQQALPLIADDLARRAASLLVENW
jgi:hypothetical protein